MILVFILFSFLPLFWHFWLFTEVVRKIPGEVTRWADEFLRMIWSGSRCVSASEPIRSLEHHAIFKRSSVTAAKLSEAKTPQCKALPLCNSAAHHKRTRER